MPQLGKVFLAGLLVVTLGGLPAAALPPSTGNPPAENSVCTGKEKKLAGLDRKILKIGAQVAKRQEQVTVRLPAAHARRTLKIEERRVKLETRRADAIAVCNPDNLDPAPACPKAEKLALKIERLSTVVTRLNLKYEQTITKLSKELQRLEAKLVAAQDARSTLIEEMTGLGCKIPG